MTLQSLIFNHTLSTMGDDCKKDTRAVFQESVPPGTSPWPLLCSERPCRGDWGASSTSLSAGTKTTVRNTANRNTENNHTWTFRSTPVSCYYEL